MFFAIEGLLETGALKGLSAKDKKNLWKMMFSQGRLYDPITAGSFEQFLKVEEWLRPKAAGKARKGAKDAKINKEALELSRLPKHLQRMMKGRIYLSSDDLTPFTGLDEIKESRQKFKELKSALTNKEKALSYPEALVVKLLVTAVTAPKSNEPSKVVTEAYSLLNEIIQAFDMNKKGKVADGFVYNTYTKVLPRVCE
jgi:hypothetical protein